jgi:hypothetical protein
MTTMWQGLLRWAAPLLLAATCWLPTAVAQRAGDIDRGYQAAPRDANEESGRTPAPAYAAAFLFTLIVMVILCTPSRKG